MLAVDTRNKEEFFSNAENIAVTHWLDSLAQRWRPFSVKLCNQDMRWVDVMDQCVPMYTLNAKANTAECFFTTSACPL